MITSQAMADKLLLNNLGCTNGFTTTANVDTLGADYVTIRVALALGNTATIASANGVTIKLQETDVATGTTSAITAFADKTGIKLPQEVRYEVDCRARKRFLQLTLTSGTAGVTNENVTATVFSTLSRMEKSPSSTADMVTGTNDQAVIG